MNRVQIIPILSVLMAAALCGGCGDEAWLGAAGGLAASETFRSWQQNLEAKKQELADRYAAVLAELEAAPDPNAIRAAREKLELIAQQQLVNDSAITTLQGVLAYPAAKAEGGRDVLLLSTLAELAGIAGLFLSRRKLAVKYNAHKAGQALFEKAHPEAGKELYAIVGKERAAAL